MNPFELKSALLAKHTQHVVLCGRFEVLPGTTQPSGPPHNGEVLLKQRSSNAYRMRDSERLCSSKVDAASFPGAGLPRVTGIKHPLRTL